MYKGGLGHGWIVCGDAGLKPAASQFDALPSRYICSFAVEQ